MRIEKLTRKGKEFAVIPVEDLQKLMDDAEMLADVRAYDAAKDRLDRGDDELSWAWTIIDSAHLPYHRTRIYLIGCRRFA